jgi:hypothetical protein
MVLIMTTERSFVIIIDNSFTISLYLYSEEAVRAMHMLGQHASHEREADLGNDVKLDT